MKRFFFLCGFIVPLFWCGGLYQIPDQVRDEEFFFALCGFIVPLFWCGMPVPDPGSSPGSRVLYLTLWWIVKRQ